MNQITTGKSEFNNFKVRFMGALKTNGGVILAFIIVFVIASIVSSKFLTFNNQMIILRTISTTALCAFAMTFVVLTSGIDLSVGSFMSLCGVPDDHIDFMVCGSLVPGYIGFDQG